MNQFIGRPDYLLLSARQIIEMVKNKVIYGKPAIPVALRAVVLFIVTGVKNPMLQNWIVPNGTFLA